MKQKDKDFDLEKIKKIIVEISRLMKEFDLIDVEIEESGRRIFLKREMPILGPETKVYGENLEKVIKSPTPGTFYGRVEPDSEPYVEIGSKVKPQTTVCMVEAMKVMNEIKAETTGTIVEILAKDGQAVEYGTSLFRVGPTK